MAKFHFDETRRRVILGSGALTALSVAGCSSVSKPSISGACSPFPSPFLAGPEVLAAWARPERYFDAHAHFFNGSDVPVEGFLAKSVAHKVEPKAVRDLLIALAPIAATLAKTFAEAPDVEMQTLCKGGGMRTTELVSATVQLDSNIDQRSSETADALHREILRRDPRIPALVNAAGASAIQSRPAASRLVNAEPFSRDFVRNAFRNGSSTSDRATNRLRSLSVEMLTPEEVDFARVQGVFQFVGFMLAPRHHNLRTYIRRQAEQSPGLPLSGCFSAMVDFNYWLDSPSAASPMRDQVLLQEQLSLLSRGFLLPLVAHNPWVDIKEHEASLKTVEWAIKEHGCVGVKIYPPMGYFPYGNNKIVFNDPDQSRPNLQELDKRLAALYELCESLEVPVMAHANESNGRNTPEDDIAGPLGWRTADTLLSNVKTLYVNAGHFGGASAHLGSTLPNQSGDWTNEFASLMKDAKRLKLYGDLGYWDELISNKDARDRLASILPRRIGGGETVADRTMYGSDWLMLSKEPGWEAYAGRIADIVRNFDQTGLIARKVLGDNVMKCYGLASDTSRTTFARLMKNFSENGQRDGPGWVPTSP